MTHPLLATSAVLAAIVVIVGIRHWLARRSPPVPVAVILEDCAQRRRWRRLLVGGVRRLHRLVGVAPVAGMALLVAETLPDGQRAACTPPRRRPDGRTVHLVSLALSVPERRLSPDEVLAALVEQYLDLTLAARPRPGRVSAPPTPAAAHVGALLRDLSAVRDGRVE